MRLRPVLIALLGAIAMLGALTVSSPATAKMKKPISVYPVPKTLTASDTTTFSFRGIKKKNLGPVIVIGKKSGRHRGRKLAHSGGRGVSFIPKGRFKKGELVTVKTRRWVRGAKKGRFWVRIGRFVGGNQQAGTPAPLDPVVGTMQSRPDLAPPELTVKTLTPEAQMGKLFFAPELEGTAIADRQGRLVWFREAGDHGTATNIWGFRTQTYRKRPVLTYYVRPVLIDKGEGGEIGVAHGHFEILNRKYKRIARVHPGNGYRPDIHGFVITPWNTALILARRTVKWNTKKLGGTADGRVLDSVVQEIDIKTGAVVFEFHSLGNVSVGASQAVVPKDREPFDYWHANSVNFDGKNALLISVRKFSTIYRLNRQNAKIMWALRGTPKPKGKPRNRRSDFKKGPGTSFAFQHDAKRLPNGDISLFDNGSASFPDAPPSINPESSGLVLRLRGKTKKSRTATLVQRYKHRPDPIVSSSRGNAEWLSGYGMFVGWGSNPQMTEFDKNGDIVFDATFADANSISYRAYKTPWHGKAPGRPAIASEAGSPDGATVWASWNGASNVRKWRVMSGPDENNLSPLATEPWANLETEIDVTGTVDAVIAVEAINKNGNVIGRSAVVPVGEQSR